ncbi:protein SON [Galendromus occidentalis]|uniref:Protein SON n=1 Tax=Galendromus occidentalis TaxID=34638 RepID=A0AAJ6VXJ5_9ACAR|nr:protein SON [Galendromus occidentalis]
MFENGTLPKGLVVDPEKMGFQKDETSDSIERYTQMCRKVREEDENEPSSSHVNHPFLVKDKPIKMNIANSISLPIKSPKEKILSAQFPVSSGCSHRQLEWRPVKPETKKQKPKPPGSATSTESTPSVNPAEDEARIAPRFEESIDPEIRSLSIPQILNRLQGASLRLESNPFDIEAKETQKHCDAVLKEMNFFIPDVKLFSAHVNPTPLPPPTNCFRHQNRIHPNLLRDTKALNSGIGMTLLQKMGWTPGTALGKNQEGVLEPLLPQIKFDRKGLVAQEELMKRPMARIPTKRPPIGKRSAVKKPMPTPANSAMNTTLNRSAAETAAIQEVIDKVLGGKHPVTLILEICVARKIKQPEFVDLPPEGEPHDRTFLCRVDFNGKVFIPSKRSMTKKLAKTQAALLALADFDDYDADKLRT